MSLSEAMLEIADQMDQKADKLSENDRGWNMVAALLHGYTAQIRIAVKAASGETQTTSAVVDATTQHRMMIDKAREEFRRVKSKTTVEEKGERMVEVVGQDELFPISSDMPVGARTLVGTQVYELREDGKLHFVERFSPAIQRGLT